MTHSSTCSPAERCEAGMIDFIAAEEDIEAILRAPFSVPISDATYPVEGLCHPRVYGSAARFLAHYVRERGILTLPQAVHKLTMQSADRLGLSRKGRIAVGADADLCLFSPENIRENRRLHRSAAACLGHGRRVRRGRTGDHGRAVYRRDTGARAAGTLTNASLFRRKL